MAITAEVISMSSWLSGMSLMKLRSILITSMGNFFR